jgi:hypothetical protein
MSAAALGVCFPCVIRSHAVTEKGDSVDIDWKARVIDDGRRVLWEMKAPFGDLHQPFMKTKFELSKWIRRQMPLLQTIMKEFELDLHDNFLPSRNSNRVMKVEGSPDTKDDFQCSTPFLVSMLLFLRFCKHSAEQKDLARIEQSYVRRCCGVALYSWLSCKLDF